MTLRRLLLGALLASLPTTGLIASTEPLALLPHPQEVVLGAGSFTIHPSARISVPRGDRGARNAAERLASLMRTSLGSRLVIAERKRSDIVFARVEGLPAEAYRLDVTTGGATISASDDAGMFYGAVSLWQLATSGAKAEISAVSISDGPRFAWRGIMLDSARHFQSVAFIKKFIDAMASHKLNVLHWHLNDDQGWRIEIKKYPRLTDVSAWRIPATAPGAPPLPRIGGFYSQKEIRDIVAYAAERHVTIVPELEMPGHALSAIRAYSQLGAGPPMKAGSESGWGVFPALYNIDDSTFGFLEDVLDEMMALFPSRYIHVGGDEAVKDQWRASDKIQAQMQQLGLKNETELQSWFMRRIGAFLTKRGRRMIGWDEILDGGLAPDATVMSWRGIDGAITAARSGHDAVLAAAPTLYLDHLQSASSLEGPGRWAPITLADVYAFEPAPAKLTATEQRHILGLQANLWTEHVRGDERAAYMAFPRASAVAELGWSAARHHDLAGFVSRLVPQIDRLKSLGIVAAPSAFVPEATIQAGDDGQSAKVSLANQVKSTIRYTIDGSLPTATSPVYTEPMKLSLPVRLRAAAFGSTGTLPGSFDRMISKDSLLRRDDRELELCNTGVALALEDDAPASGRRANSLIGITEPCWIYRKARLDGVSAITIDIGQIPFNFQIGKDIEKIRFRAPVSDAGEAEVRLGGCDGVRIAVLPLAHAARNPAVSRLTAQIAPQSGVHDLCFTYTATGPDPLWTMHAVQLVKP